MFNFQKEMEEVINTLKENNEDFYEDLKGMYLLNIENNDIENKKNGLKHKNSSSFE